MTGPHPLGRRVGGHQLGMRRLQIDELAHQHVVLDVGDLGIVEHVIPVVVVLQRRRAARRPSSAGSVTGSIQASVEVADFADSVLTMFEYSSRTSSATPRTLVDPAPHGQTGPTCRDRPGEGSGSHRAHGRDRRECGSPTSSCRSARHHRARQTSRRRPTRCRARSRPRSRAPAVPATATPTAAAARDQTRPPAGAGCSCRPRERRPAASSVAGRTASSPQRRCAGARSPRDILRLLRTNAPKPRSFSHLVTAPLSARFRSPS